MAGDLVRYSVRHRVARLLNDSITSTATSASTTTLTDTAELVNYATDTLVGCYVYVYSSTLGIGQERKITANVTATGVITVPTWTAPTGTILYEIHRGWRVYQYNEAINQAVNDVLGDNGALIANVVDESIVLIQDGTQTSYEYTMPTGFRMLYGGMMEVEGVTTGIYDESPLKYNTDFTLQKTTAATSSAQSIIQIVIDRRAYEPLAGRHLRIRGAKYQPELTDDNAVLLSEHLVQFVTHQAAYYLLDPETGFGTPSSSANAQRAQRHFQMAEAARMRMEHRAPPASIMVPV